MPVYIQRPHWRALTNRLRHIQVVFDMDDDSITLIYLDQRTCHELLTSQE
jgi:hypothetical protein